MGLITTLSSDGSQIAVGIPLWGASTEGSSLAGALGQVRIYSWNGTDWDIGATLNGNIPDEKLGRRVAMSSDGRMLAVESEPLVEPIIRIFRLEGGNGTVPEWTQLGEDIIVPKESGRFGVNLALSSHMVRLAFSFAKTARVYQGAPDTATWDIIGTDVIIESDVDISSLAMSRSGEVLTIGAPGVTCEKNATVSCFLSVFEWPDM